MNKKTVKLIQYKYPIVVLIILILIYTYLNIPDNVQRGGAVSNGTIIKLLILLLPVFLLVPLGSAMRDYYFVYPYVTMWDMGQGFFSGYRKAALAPSGTIDENDLRLYSDINRISSKPTEPLYIHANYFCEVARPCNCCLIDDYVKYFPKGTCKSTPSSSSMPSFKSR